LWIIFSVFIYLFYLLKEFINYFVVILPWAVFDIGLLLWRKWRCSALKNYHSYSLIESFTINDRDSLDDKFGRIKSLDKASAKQK